MGTDIRYCKLHFTLAFDAASVLPRTKASALRGGMGEMLLRMHCIRDRNCAVCDFESECLVRRTMYSKMEIQPAFMSAGDSVGYVLECGDNREQIPAGGTLRFNLVLFGKTIVYFSQFLLALQMLGTWGLGKQRAHFRLVRVTNTRQKDIMDGENIVMSRVETERISDYVAMRRRHLRAEHGTGTLRMDLKAPLSLKFRGRQLEAFDMEAVMEACARRLYILNCFEGTETEQADVKAHVPRLIAQEARGESVRRYSSTHDEKIRLDGFSGHADIGDVDETALELLLACEVPHIGKNTSFGFGQYGLAAAGKTTETEA